MEFTGGKKKELRILKNSVNVYIKKIINLMLKITHLFYNSFHWSGIQAWLNCVLCFRVSIKVPARQHSFLGLWIPF